MLPEALQNSWRREAGGGRWLFAPAASDLQPPALSDASAAALAHSSADRATGSSGCAAGAQPAHGPRRKQQQEEAGEAEALERRALARVLFWARWSLGEPVIVRGVKVGVQLSAAMVAVICRYIAAVLKLVIITTAAQLHT